MNSLVSNLKEMLKLEERRAELVKELDGLTSKLSELKGSLNLDSKDYGDSEGATAPKRRGRKPGGAKASSPAKKSGRAPRGQMKQLIMSELEGAGSEGLGVKELADRLGVRNTAVHAWFNTTGKKVGEIKKVGTARYALSGRGSSAKSSDASAPRKYGRGTTAKKTAKSGKRKGNVRGQLKSTIMSTLQKAGGKGMSVREISDKTGVPYKNVYIWFVTTGKKNSDIERTAPATYRLKS